MLRDLIKPDLKLVICGTAVSPTSARVGKYYAGPGNKFWKILSEVGLTPFLLSPERYEQLLEYGIGLTDLVKNRSALDDLLSSGDFGTSRVAKLLRMYKPSYVCFNGKRAACEFLGRAVNYGVQGERIGNTSLFVAPSTSGAANRYWDESYWSQLAQICLKDCS
jgi:double-stranded uracil-DNA glycosylase